MARFRPNPPAPRNGVNPGCVVLQAGHWATLAEFLVARFPNVGADPWMQRLTAGDVIDDQGTVLTRHSPFQPGQRIYYFRAVAAEPPIPFFEQVIYQDDHLLVVDKPHFLPVMPSGGYLQETVLTRQKIALQCPDLSPIHRIDRDTAGLVLFSKQRSTRNAYHALFRDRQVHKAYEAIAPWNPDLPWPIRRESRLAASAHFMQQQEIDGPPNTLTVITPLEVHGPFARYQLEPLTGHRHQLRVHMAALGMPICGDGIYPILTPEGQTDFENPLQLLAKSIAFVDPVSGQALKFESARKLHDLKTSWPQC